MGCLGPARRSLGMTETKIDSSLCLCVSVVGVFLFHSHDDPRAFGQFALDDLD